MPKQILSVGNCAADNASLSSFVKRHFDAVVVPAEGEDAALEKLRSGDYDLILVNRLLDADGSEGLPIIKRLRQDAELAEIPAMLLTNYPEHQEQAVAAGARPGFGKSDVGSHHAVEILRGVLESS